jgi:hypothetical protein
MSLSKSVPPWCDPAWGQQLADNLNRKVLASAKARASGADWTEWRLGDRVFRVSPDQMQARELEPDRLLEDRRRRLRAEIRETGVGGPSSS